MANRYWVGGTASWDGTAGTKWALTSGGAGGQAIPTSADDVFFDASSGANTVTIATGNTGAKSITCTGFTGTLAGTAAISVSGNVTLATGMTITYSGVLSLIATSTFTSAGKTFTGNITINGSGITVTLADALTMTNRTLTLTQGTFTTANFNVTLGTFSTLVTNTRTINLGSSTVTNTADWFIIGTNLTFNAGTSTITKSGGSFVGGSKTYYNVTFTNVNTNIAINDANTFNTFTVNSPTSAGLFQTTFDSATTITTMVFSGGAANQRLMLLSDTLGTARTLTITTWTTVSDVDFRDITLTNAKSGTRLGDCGGNTNITFPAPKTVYWNLSGVRDWSATAWATSSGGAPSANNFPLAQDTVVFDDTGAAGTVSQPYNYNLGTVNMSGRTSAMTLLWQGNATCYGSWSFGSGVTVSASSTGRITLSGRSTQVITSNGKTFIFGIYIIAPGGTVQLADALTVNWSGGNILFRGGTLNLNGFTFTVSDATQGFADSNIGLARNITFNGGTLAVAGTSGFSYSATNFTTTAGTGTGAISLTSASPKSFTGTGGTFNCTLNQGGAGALTITGANTFSDISNTYSATGATTITLAANQTVSNFTATGTSGKVLTLNSSVAGTARTLTKTSGTVSVDYMSIRDSTATGGATWYAGANSTNVSNNTGWIFTAAPTSTGFLIFFN